jgi:hypothetical protein
LSVSLLHQRERSHEALRGPAGETKKKSDNGIAAHAGAVGPGRFNVARDVWCHDDREAGIAHPTLIVAERVQTSAKRRLRDGVDQILFVVAQRSIAAKPVADCETPPGFNASAQRSKKSGLS